MAGNNDRCMQAVEKYLQVKPTTKPDFTGDVRGRREKPARTSVCGLNNPVSRAIKCVCEKMPKM
jgi:hypothetical protein